MQEAHKNTDTKKQYTPAGSYTPPLFLSVLARKTKARVKML